MLAIVEANSLRDTYLCSYGLAQIENHPGEPLTKASSDCDRISSVSESSR